MRCENYVTERREHKKSHGAVPVGVAKIPRLPPAPSEEGSVERKRKEHEKTTVLCHRECPNYLDHGLVLSGGV